MGELAHPVHYGVGATGCSAPAQAAILPGVVVPDPVSMEKTRAADAGGKNERRRVRVARLF